MIRGLFGLQGKFFISLLIAAALPFFVGIIVFEVLGYRHMLAEQGEMHRLEAASLVASITQASNAEAEKFRVWMSAESDLVNYAEVKTKEASALSPIEASDSVLHLDEIWQSLPLADPKVQKILHNPAADILRHYQQQHPQAAELMLTDSLGRLIAATDKTSDYNQADEYWWKSGESLQSGQIWQDAIHYDASSKVFAIDCVMPLRKDGQLAGLVKMSVDVSRLIPHPIMRSITNNSSWYFVLRSGQILVSSDHQIKSLKSSIPYDVLTQIRSHEDGWMVAKNDEGNQEIIGFTAFGSDYLEPKAYMVCSSFTKDLFEPLWGNFIGLAMAGSSLLGLCLITGFYIIQRKVLRPLSRIEDAVRSLSKLARLHKNLSTEPHEIRLQHEVVERHLRRIQKIRTGDQMELLSREIATMISRVLNYQSELDRADRQRKEAEAEVAAEAAEAESEQP